GSASTSLPAPSKISSRSDPFPANRPVSRHRRLHPLRSPLPPSHPLHSRPERNGIAAPKGPTRPSSSAPSALSSASSALPGNQELTMHQQIRQLLNQLPPKPFRSKLEPHLDLIRELRQKRLTYEDISEFLAQNLNLTVAPSTIYAFMHVRARRR